jgi:site-specific recombinase XerD
MKKLTLQSAHYLYLEQSYLEWLEVIGYSPSAIKNWPVHVHELLHYLEGKNIKNITLVSSEHVQWFINYIKYRRNHTRAGALSSSSINGIINAINSFATYLNSTGKYLLDVTPIREENNTSVTTILSIEEVKALYEATFSVHRGDNMAIGQRDRAIIAIFYGCGLRREEGMSLNLADIDLDRKLLFVRKGKGNKQRYVPIAAKHVEDIRTYITEGRDWFLYRHYAEHYNRKYPQRKSIPDEDAFFIGQHGQRMKSFYQRLEYMRDKAGIETHFGLHTLRHSIATHLLQSGMSIEEIARFLGHSSLDSTQIYTHIVNQLKRN